MEAPRYWRLQKIRYRLIGDHCLVCHKPTFPPKDFCNKCSIENLLNLKKKKGIIYESTQKTILNIPTQAEKVQG